MYTHKVRRTLKDEGWKGLTADEQRFTMLDRVLRPDLYLWMQESEHVRSGLTTRSTEANLTVVVVVPYRSSAL